MPSVINEQAFAQEVLQSSTPVLVHFWAPWCGVCRMIEPALERVRSEFGESLKLVGINADENLRLTSNYRITNLPTVLVFKEGRLLHRLEQLHRKDEVKSSLEKVLSLIH
ncbi:MAG: thiol reductase thioredoxin [Alkalinema sp. CACIAM 70d]|nr:MAG: thiol reductase thioredoxin [Alkalinema sp. CACIAM 70d]